MARTITFSQDTLEAMQEEMRRDPTVFLMGEDGGRYGGTFLADELPAPTAGAVGVSRCEWKSSIFQVHCQSSFDQTEARSYRAPLFQSLRFCSTATRVCRGQAVSEANQAHQLAT